MLAYLVLTLASAIEMETSPPVMTVTFLGFLRSRVVAYQAKVNDDDDGGGGRSAHRDELASLGKEIGLISRVVPDVDDDFLLARFDARFRIDRRRMLASFKNRHFINA